MEDFKFLVDENSQGIRIDKFLSEKLNDISRSRLQKLIEEGHVKIDGTAAQKNSKISKNQTISVVIPEAKPLEVKPENIPLDIVYEDDDLIVVNKPKGMVVHPAPGNYDGTLVNALLHHCKGSLSGINGVIRPGIVHRIDKDTSGLLIVAKNDKTHNELAVQIKDHSFEREYEAVIHGHLKSDSGTVRTFITRHKIDRKKMAVSESSGKLAITHYEVTKKYQKYSHLKLKLETGRTHQIRVHMSYLGHPIAGDEVYGKSRKNEFPFLKGQCLHARTLGFFHPTLKKHMRFSSNLPEYFQKVLDSIS